MRIARSTSFSLACAIALWSFVALRSAAAQQPQQPPPFAPVVAAASWGTPARGAHSFVGSRACELCHENHQNRADEFVLLSECEIWKGADKHYQAFEFLKLPRSRAIGERMQIADVTRDARCLACHSALPLDQLKPGPDAQAALEIVADQKVRITDGVGCEGCHGPAGRRANGDPGWLQEHASLERQDQSWRSRTAADKFERFGMWDVRNLVTQTQVCASCHIGNVAQGKVITHEMYAAGHPPLPPFEFSSFVSQMPRHWRLTTEKSPKAVSDYERDAKASLPQGDFENTRQVAISTLVTLSESLKLSADLLTKEVQPPAEIPKPAFPELASYSCFHCHHELQSPGWRQDRKLRSPPGRPLFHEWPFAVTKAVVRLGGDGLPSTYDRLVDGVYEDLGRQAFGDEMKLPKSLRNLATWLETTATSLSERTFTKADAETLFDQLCEIGATETLDYDSARQLVWATERIYADLKTSSRKDDRDRLVQSNRQLLRSPGWLTETPRDPVEEALKSIEVQGGNGLLVLNLRLGTPGEAVVNQQPRPVVEVDLATILPPIDVYEPARFKAAFQQIREAKRAPSPSPLLLPPQR